MRMTTGEAAGPTTVRRIAGWLLAGAALALVPVGPGKAQDRQQAGVSAAVKGDVQLARGDAVGRQVESGQPIFLQDAITSGPASNLQILLLDESVFTVGPSSEITIDRFVYDPAAESGELTASFAKGVARFVTGKIAADEPENMKIDLPVGTIGIRGTIGVVEILDVEEARRRLPDQTRRLVGEGGGQNGGQPVVFAALAGPGPNNDADEHRGAFQFSTPDGSVDLNRPGGAVLATPGAPPVFFIAPPGLLQGVTQRISGGATGAGEEQYQQEGTGGDGGDVAPEQTEETSGSSPITTTETLDSLDESNETQTATETVSDPSGTAGAQAGVTLQELVAANSGTASGSVGINGTITGSLSFLLDFGNRTFDFQASGLNGGGLTSAAIGVAGGSAGLPSDSRRALTIGNNGEDFAADTTSCDNCSLSVIFPTNTSFEATVEHAGATGTAEDSKF